MRRARLAADGAAIARSLAVLGNTCRRAEQGKAHLARVDASGVPLGKTSAYAQERLSELRRTMR